jgi:tetratricopeptide (TPR) repeat protein
VAKLQLQGSLFAIALDHLSLGLAELIARHATDDANVSSAATQLQHAVDHLRRAQRIDYVPLGLIARAAFLRNTQKFALARRDLDEAMRIARRSEMRLHHCDAHLEYARLALAEGDKEQARGHVAEARRLVEETGYGRRRPEVEALEAEVR